MSALYRSFVRTGWAATMLATAPLLALACDSKHDGEIKVCLTSPGAKDEAGNAFAGEDACTESASAMGVVSGRAVPVHLRVTLTANGYGGANASSASVGGNGPGAVQGSLSAHVYVEGFTSVNSTGSGMSDATVSLTLNAAGANYEGDVTIQIPGDAPLAPTICAEVAGQISCGKVELKDLSAAEVGEFGATLCPYSGTTCTGMPPPAGVSLYRLTVTGIAPTAPEIPAKDLPVSFAVLSTSNPDYKTPPAFNPPSGSADAKGEATSFIFLSDTDTLLVSIKAGSGQQTFFLSSTGASQCVSCK